MNRRIIFSQVVAFELLGVGEKVFNFITPKGFSNISLRSKIFVVDIVVVDVSNKGFARWTVDLNSLPRQNHQLRFVDDKKRKEKKRKKYSYKFVECVETERELPDEMLSRADLR